MGREVQTDPAGISLDVVTAWICDHIEGVTAPLAFTRIKGGHSNLTYEIDDAAGRKLVLRRPPLGELLPTAHDMSREWRFISAFHETPVPVPPPLAYCDDTAVTGASFYVMGFVEGHVLHDSSVAENYDEAQRRKTGESFVDVLADMHAEDPDEIGVGDIARKEGYIPRQLKRWYSQWNASKTRELPLVDELHDTFATNVPEQGAARVVHGDYRLGNCISRAPQKGGGIDAVLDWEIATLGDPLADVGYAVSRWAEAGELEGRGNPSVLAGFPSRKEFLDRYAARSSRDLSQIDYYIAFAHWKTACIVEGVYARYLHGALDSTGINLDMFKLTVDASVQMAQTALDG